MALAEVATERVELAKVPDWAFTGVSEFAYLTE